MEHPSNHDNFLVTFAAIASKFEFSCYEKVGPTFSSLNACPFLPPVKTDDRSEFQCLNNLESLN